MTTSALRPPVRRALVALAPRPELTITVLGAAPIGQGAISGGGTHTTAAGATIRRPARHTNGKQLIPWRTAVEQAARTAMTRAGWTTVPKPHGLALSATYYLPRPKSVPRTARPYPTLAAPGIFDLTHLTRAIEDALTRAGVWEDDSQVIGHGDCAKRYADYRPPGAVITIGLVTD